MWGRGCRWQRAARPVRFRAGRTARPARRPATPRRLNWQPDPRVRTGAASVTALPRAHCCRRLLSETRSSHHLLEQRDKGQLFGFCRPALGAFLDELHVGVSTPVVDEGAEALELFRVLEGVGPFAFVAVDHQLHLRLQLCGQAQAVVDDDRLEIVESAFQRFTPDRGTLQLVGSADVEHQETVDVTNQGFIIQIGGEQLGVTRTHAAVAAQVKVPAVFGGNHADVLALRFGAFAGAAGYRKLEFVRRAQALVTVLDAQRHGDTVLHAVAAPGAADAGFNRTGRLAVGMAGLEACLDQLAPDIRQLVQLRAEQVDALAAGDLGVQVVFFRHRANRYQAVRGNLATRNTWHHRVGAVFLHVGHERIVGVLQRHQRRLGDGAVPARRQDRADCGLADVAAMRAFAMASQQFVKGFDAFDADHRVQLLAGMSEVFTQAFIDRHAAGHQFMLENLFEQCSATTAAGGGLGAGLDCGQIGAPIVDGRAHGAFADVMAGADGRCGGQGIGAQRGRAFATRQNQARWIGGQRDAVLRILQQCVVIAVIADQHSAEYLLAIGRHHQATVAGGSFINEAITDGPGQRTVRITDGADIHTQQLELGGHVGAEERVGILFAQLCCHTAGHLIAGRDQAEHAAVPGCAFADGIDISVAGAAVLVDCDATAWAERQLTLTGQGVLRTNTCGEHDQVGLEKLVVGEVHPIAILLAVADRLRGAGQMHADAQRFDTRLQCSATEVVQLHRHETRRELDDMGFQPQGFKRIGRFESEQTAADHYASSGLRRGIANAVQILECAIDQPGIAPRAFDRRYERVGARGQDQFVVTEAAFGGDDFVTITIDFQHRYAEVQRQAGLFVDRHLAHGQRFGVAACEVFGQVHAVIGALCFLAKDVDAIAFECAACDQLLDAMMPDHAITDDDQGFYIVEGEDCGVHSESRPRPIRFFKAKKKRPEPFGSRRLCLLSYWVFGGAIEPRCRKHPSSPLVSARLAIHVDQPGRPDHIHGGVVEDYAEVVPACVGSAPSPNWQCTQGCAVFTTASGA
ncbi:hypothetical protein ALP62_05513 [Pseudomonas syringae pv. aceris]|nr:hypothetical protein ALP62_05513 [Pseudomonas syringae pv. aceris]